ncbi:ribosome silencing factor [Dehalococcoidia bacterium]|nr:ribosome silencing factor [Dehalococcoidia bacterium]
MDPIVAARNVVDIVADKQASDVLLLDIRNRAAFADFFVLCSADSTRQVSAIANAVEDAMHADGFKLRHREGTNRSGWVLLDFNDLIVHIFSPQERQYYDLESAWGTAPQLVRVP